jgi:hypothetical protein
VKVQKQEVARFACRIAHFGAMVGRLLVETGAADAPEGLVHFQTLLHESRAAVEVRW